MNGPLRRLHLGIVVQRYGLEINGGAEYHARLIARHLAPLHDVEVFTTTALDYVTWAPHFPEGQETIEGIRVNRFPVARPRDPARFGQIQEIVLNEEHSSADELAWLEEEGPLVPALIRELELRQGEFDFLIFFSYRYYHSFHGLSRLPREKTILVPTAEHDEVIYLKLFKRLFHRPAAIVYNSLEERQLIERISANGAVPGDIVGVGSEIPAGRDPARAQARWGLEGKYAVYIGRLDENKGVPSLLAHFFRYLQEEKPELTLALAGRSVIPIPDHPRIRPVGFVSDAEKFDLLEGAEFLIIPSPFESLSMVSLEAWACGKPVLASGRTEVLVGQCRRSQAGLWYDNYEEFRETVALLADDEELKRRCGENGRRFFTENYSWPVIVAKYQRLFAQLGNAH
ncbi:MAG TPA: glycosyltransferase family 4 protein [Candidatus Aminicenantes bacterium]|nr:glycosyltransferase family 4 protein [Candidatus Aminicenantes bacterium]